MGLICDGSPYWRNGNYAGLGQCIPPLSLEFYPLGFLSGFGGGFWVYASCPKEGAPEVLRGMPTFAGGKDGWDSRSGH